MWILNVFHIFCLIIMILMIIKLFAEDSSTEISQFNFNMILFILNIFGFIISGFSSFISIFGLGMGFAGMLIWFPIRVKLKDIPKESYLNFKELFCFFTIKK